MFIHTNHEEVIELPTDHDGIPSLHVCHTRHIVLVYEVEETKA